MYSSIEISRKVLQRPARFLEPTNKSGPRRSLTRTQAARVHDFALKLENDGEY